MSLTLLPVALAAVLASGCSTFSRNDAAATVNDHELSIDDYEELAQHGVTTNSLGEVSGDTGRDQLTAWISVTALVDALEDDGVIIDDAARAEARQTLESTDPETWATFSDSYQRLQIEYRVAIEAILDRDDILEQIQSAYEAGDTFSGVICLRFMAFDTVTEANEVLDELEAGGDFATLADDHPFDPEAAPNGGILADSAGNECVSASDPNFAGLGEVIAGSVVGEVFGPVTLEDQTFLFLPRPYDEVADDVRLLIGPGVAQSVAREYIADIKPTIDSRYGMWDAEQRRVVPSR